MEAYSWENHRTKWALFQQAMFDDTKRVSEFCISIHIYPELWIY